MKILLQAVVTSLILLSFTGCNSNSSAASDPKIKQKSRSCVPESELLAKNIVRGVTVKPSDFDSKMVMMLVSNGELCTAAAIAPNILLTAAHCIEGNEAQTRAYFHPSVSCESGFNTSFHGISVSKLVVHPSFDKELAKTHAEQITGDIAIVFLTKNIPEGYKVFKIAGSGAVANGKDLFLYGYGRTGAQSGGAGVLRKAIVDHSKYSLDIGNKKINIDQATGSGICNGDSGGPGFINTDDDLQILGVNSYVIGPKSDICSSESFQTYVPAYQNWIKSVINTNDATK